MFNEKKSALLAAIVVVVISVGSVSLTTDHVPKKTNSIEQFYSVNQLNLKYSYVLIITQNSMFKNNVVKIVSDHFYSKPILFSVIDVTELASTQEDLWDNIIIVTAIENNDFVLRLDDFISKQKDPEKICLVLTSDNGKWNGMPREGVDVITTTSHSRNTGKISGKIIDKIDPIVLR